MTRVNTVNCHYNASNLSRYYIRHCDNSGRIWIRSQNHNRHPISHPHGRAMGCLLWGFGRKLTALKQHCVVLYPSIALTWLRCWQSVWWVQRSHPACLTPWPGSVPDARLLPNPAPNNDPAQWCRCYLRRGVSQLWRWKGAFVQHQPMNVHNS